MNRDRTPDSPTPVNLRRLMLAVTCTGFIAAAEAGPSNLWTDNVLSESQVIPLTTPNQGLARARQLMADGDHARAARALSKIAARWPSSEEARQLLALSLQKAQAINVADGTPENRPVLAAGLPEGATR